MSTGPGMAVAGGSVSEDMRRPLGWPMVRHRSVHASSSRTLPGSAVTGSPDHDPAPPLAGITRQHRPPELSAGPLPARYYLNRLRHHQPHAWAGSAAGPRL